MSWRRLLSRLSAAACGFAAVFSPAAAFAGTDSDTLTVTANVVASCDITANDLDFGNYDPISATPNDAASTISVTCTNGTGYEIALNAGIGAGATVAARKMANGADLLTYSLYSNALRTTLWGQTSGGGGNVVVGTGTGAAQVIDLYGRIPINQTAPAGAYTDTITATVTY